MSETRYVRFRIYTDGKYCGKSCQFLRGVTASGDISPRVKQFCILKSDDFDELGVSGDKIMRSRYCLKKTTEMDKLAEQFTSKD
jgi:hypothetical protein